MLIFYRFLSCSTECSNQITPCCTVLRILLRRESKRGLHSWTAVRTCFFPVLLCESSASRNYPACYNELCQNCSLFFCNSLLVFLDIIWAECFWCLTFKKPICISAVLTTKCFPAWPLRHRPLQDFTSCDFHPLKPGQLEFTFWFWLKTLSHLRMKAKFSPHSSITFKPDLNPVLKYCSSLKLQTLMKSSITSRVTFCRNLFKR